MLRCSKCQSAAVMPKSGLCIACGFITVSEKFQEDVSDSLLVNEVGEEPVEEDTHLIEDQEQPILIDFPELNTMADDSSDILVSQQENIPDTLGVKDDETITLSKETHLTDEPKNKQSILTDFSELNNAKDVSSNSDTLVSRQAPPSDTLVTVDDEKIALSESTARHEFEVDSLEWEASVPPFLQVTHKAKLKKSYTRIIESCQKDLEPLKGSLVSKGDGTARSFMVSSTYRKEGVTTSALAVSIALSRFGHSKVLLVDANAVAPSLHDAFSLTDCPGFIDYISGADFSINKKSTVHSIYQEMEGATRVDNACLWAKYAYYTEYKGLYVMPYALKINSSSLWDIVESATFNNKLEQLKQAFDYIVFDAPAILGSSEPALLSQYIEGVILVIEAEKTKWEVTELAVNNVRNSGGTFVGAILNKRKFYIPKFLYRWI